VERSKLGQQGGKMAKTTAVAVAGRWKRAGGEHRIDDEDRKRQTEVIEKWAGAQDTGRQEPTQGI
jgi:hypothetical protein